MHLDESDITLEYLHNIVFRIEMEYCYALTLSPRVDDLGGSRRAFTETDAIVQLPAVLPIGVVELQWKVPRLGGNMRWDSKTNPVTANGRFFTA